VFCKLAASLWDKEELFRTNMSALNCLSYVPIYYRKCFEKYL
jgi:hypothetical protein